jgi:peptidoglycan/LPS O-acetylase OafA/YrhL
MSKQYFKGLDGLRGIAAILVVLGHIELLKKTFNFNNVYDGGGPFFLYLGSLAVTFFFVLSGFLITFLLLKEKEQKGSISIRNFYLRRLLRIWPVYYVLFILGFLIFPRLYIAGIIMPKPIEWSSYWNSFFFNLVLLPNFAKVSNPIAFQSWSIGVEEQFYIFWPILVLKIKSLKKLFIAMVSIVVGIY